jgi:hypothetical protein
MGFSDVLLYHPGKMDWMAAGLPTEGEDSERLAAELMNKAVPACGPGERLGDVASRLDGWSWCAVVDDDGVLLGRISRDTIVEQPDARAFEAAEPGPSTYRASLSTIELLETMQQSDEDVAFRPRRQASRRGEPGGARA